MSHDDHGWFNLCPACEPPHTVRVWRRSADLGKSRQPIFDDDTCATVHIHRRREETVVIHGPAAWMVRGGYLTPEDLLA